MKKATATSHGTNRFTVSPAGTGGAEAMLEPAEIMLVTTSIADPYGQRKALAFVVPHVLRVSKKQKIVEKSHFVFLRNTHLFQICVILAE
jgi:hypothetical protein